MMKLHSRRSMKTIGLSTLTSLASLSGVSNNGAIFEMLKRNMREPSGGSIGLSLKMVSTLTSPNPSMMMVVVMVMMVVVVTATAMVVVVRSN